MSLHLFFLYILLSFSSLLSALQKHGHEARQPISIQFLTLCHGASPEGIQKQSPCLSLAGLRLLSDLCLLPFTLKGGNTVML